MRKNSMLGLMVLLAGCGGGGASHEGSGGAGGQAPMDGGSGGHPAGDAAPDGDAAMDAGSDSTGTCPFTPCGGDPVGTWTIDGVCLTTTHDTWVAMYQCDDIDGTMEASYTGTWTFKGDGTYSRVATNHFVYHYSIALSCLNEADCASYAASLTGTTCSGGAVCTCTSDPGEAAQVSDNGTYTVSGSSLTTIRSDGASSTRQFCVSGNHLAIVSSGIMTQTIMAHR